MPPSDTLRYLAPCDEGIGSEVLLCFEILLGCELDRSEELVGLFLRDIRRVSLCVGLVSRYASDLLDLGVILWRVIGEHVGEWLGSESGCGSRGSDKVLVRDMFSVDASESAELTLGVSIISLWE